MAKVPVDTFLNYCKDAADIGGQIETVRAGIVGGKNRHGYVYGGQGETYSQALAEKWTEERRSVPKTRDRSTYFIADCARWYGRKVEDCSGLIVNAIRTVIPKFGDRTANRFIKTSCSETGGMAAMPETAGIVLWKNGHIGVYVGDGWVIEARGTEYGVVKSKISTQPWKKWGYLKDVDYGADKSEWSVSRVLKRMESMLRGDDVKELQRRIGVTADGAFGAATEAAVKAYQKRQGLTPDGRAGRDTIAALGGVWRD